MAQGQVAWFNAEKGFGFVTPDDGSADVFVHFTAIADSGYRSLQEGQRVEYEVVPGDRGPQARRVHPLEPGTAGPALPEPTGRPLGTVAWFDDDKGFGFVTPDGGGDDLFVHFSSIVGEGGHRSLAEGARVELDVVQGDRGPQAAQVQPVADDREPEAYDDAGRPDQAGPYDGPAGVRTATVLWFRGEKGFGFLSPDDGTPDLFVHASALVDDGSYRGLQEGERVAYEVVDGERGPQAAEVRPLRDGAAPGRPQGTVSWFDADKGFGFVSPYDGGPDLFAHHSAIRESTGYRCLEEGARVEFDVVEGDRGPQAADIVPVRDAPRSPGAGPSRTSGTVKRFDVEKGFGFLSPDDGGRDVFVHWTSLVDDGGFRTLEQGQRVEFDVVQGDRGPQAADVTPLDRTPVPVPGRTEGTVLWFAADKGFGFVQPADGGPDVFVHATALAPSAGSALEPGQLVELDVVPGDRGPQGQDVRPL